METARPKPVAEKAPAENPRGCYCGLWETKPEFMREKNYPPGFCGFCERCGAPGHTRHFPGPVPYTGTWCDRCYRIVPWTNPITLAQRLAVIGALVAVTWFIIRFALR